MATLSAIIPCFNNGILLSEMIECVINQSYEDWELIIVDDKSTDNTLEIINKYVKLDKRILLYVRDREPKGSVTCRNIGLMHSSGKYIIHLDADDLISNTCFEKRVYFMDTHPDCDYASFPARSFVDKNNLPLYDSKGKIWGDHCKYCDLLESFLKADYAFTTWNNIYRKSSIVDIFWDENVKIYTDFSFLVPCVLDGLKHEFSGLKELDYYYRVAPSNNAMTSNFVTEEKFNSTLFLFKKIMSLLSQRDDYIKRKHEFEVYIALQIERLMLNGNRNQALLFIEFCKTYYSGFVLRKFVFLLRNVHDGSKSCFDRIRFNLYLFCLFGRKRYVGNILRLLGFMK